MRGILFLGGQLLQHLEVFDLPLELAEGSDERTQSRNFLDIALRALAIIPEIRRGHARLDRA